MIFLLRLSLPFLFCAVLADCARPGAALVVVQNGLEVHTLVHRDTADRHWRILTVAVRDAPSQQPITDAEVGIASGGAPAQPATNKGDGSYEVRLDQAPGSSARISVAILARQRSLFFELRRP